MKKFLVVLIIALLFLFCNIGFAQDQPVTRDLVASLAQLPGLADSPDKGAYVDIVKAIDDVYPGKIKIEVVPMIRSINNVVEGTADFHVPSLRNPLTDLSKLPYRYLTEKTGSVTDVIYSNKDKIITKKMIDDALATGGKFPYVIEVVGGMEANFPFPALPSRDIEQSLQKVQDKRLDAMIRVQDESDRSLEKLKLNMIHRSFYAGFDDVIIIPKGSKGDELDKILSDCLRKLKASGRMQELYKKAHLPYKEWQPSEMSW